MSNRSAEALAARAAATPSAASTAGEGSPARVQKLRLGYAAAWPVVVKVFEAEWSVDWGGVAALLAGAALVAGLGGMLAAFQALSQRPAAALRGD